MDKVMLRLVDVQNGMQVRITSFEGGFRQMNKLNRFGIYPGDLARVVRRAPFRGPLLLEVRGMEIALGRGIAAQILVEIDPCVSR
jgi:Fe2+ transport system protein FeoA